MPLEFLKRRGGDADAAQPSQAPAVGLPEEVVAQDYQLKLYYAGKSSEGVRMQGGPARARRAAVDARGHHARATSRSSSRCRSSSRRRCPQIVRPSEAMQWLNAHHQLSPITRHALVVLETIDAIDLAFDTFACALLDGETDTSGYPEYNAVVGGVASHWDEATGDMIVRGVVGWGGRGVRGDTDRIGSRILGGLLTNILANQFALGLTAVERPVPAAGRGGLVCAHCGFASGPRAGVLLPQVRDAAAPRLTRREPDADLRVPLHRVRASRGHPPRDQRARRRSSARRAVARGRCASSSRRRRSISRARAGRRRTAARRARRGGRRRRGPSRATRSDGVEGSARLPDGGSIGSRLVGSRLLGLIGVAPVRQWLVRRRQAPAAHSKASGGSTGSEVVKSAGSELGRIVDLGRED